MRVVWLLEELGLPYTLERVEFAPISREFFIQKTPLGKLIAYLARLQARPAFQRAFAPG